MNYTYEEIEAYLKKGREQVPNKGRGYMFYTEGDKSYACSVGAIMIGMDYELFPYEDNERQIRDFRNRIGWDDQKLIHLTSTNDNSVEYFKVDPDKAVLDEIRKMSV